ncbi:MAG: IS5 family transposase [Bacteroidales bacterium]
MAKSKKYRASKQSYVSPNQLTLAGFETPFHCQLRTDNRWVVLAKKIPWDTLIPVYQQQMGNEITGATGINPRVALGALMIKHICNLSDRETIQQIQENMYMQYFIGFSSFCDQEPFDASLFVSIRKRLGLDQINAINEKIVGLNHQITEKQNDDNDREQPKSAMDAGCDDKAEKEQAITHHGDLLMDATACPQDIAYPTDLNLLDDAREKSEELIDILFQGSIHGDKPRTYRQKARKQYLQVAQKRRKTKKEVRKSIRSQLNYLKRNIQSIDHLLDHYTGIPLDSKQYKYLLVIQTLYQQQELMYTNRTHSVDHRIVSIHQPHVRPIVRGKTNANVEFGAKVQVSMMDGFAFLDDLGWEAFNEGTRLMHSVKKYYQRMGYYPKRVLADKIYCTRENRRLLKEFGIELRAKPLGRPKAVEAEHVRPGERNPIEGKFGQAKTAYGLNRIRARLPDTSESWIATIILVLNLVKLAGSVTLMQIFERLSFSARSQLYSFSPYFSKFRLFFQKNNPIEISVVLT